MKLVFLISQPRSGSTLLQAILGSHPEVCTCSEPWIALPFVYALKKEGCEYEFDVNLSNTAIRSFFSESGIVQEYYNSSLNTFLSSLYQKALENTGKRVFLDKTPRYYEIASELKDIFPEAKFIVLFRHPLSVLNSICTTWVKGSIDRLYYHSRDLFEAPRKLVDFASSHDDVLTVSYEDLVTSPRTEVGKICKYIGIDYLDQIINYKAEANWTYGDKNFLDKKAPDSASIDSWKSRLQDRRMVNFYQYYLNELGEDVFESLGYSYKTTLAEIEKHHPDGKDFKTWKLLLQGDYILSIEDQRKLVREKTRGNFFSRLLRTLKP